MGTMKFLHGMFKTQTPGRIKNSSDIHRKREREFRCGKYVKLNEDMRICVFSVKPGTTMGFILVTQGL